MRIFSADTIVLCSTCIRTASKNYWNMYYINNLIKNKHTKYRDVMFLNRQYTLTCFAIIFKEFQKPQILGLTRGSSVSFIL